MIPRLREEFDADMPPVNRPMSELRTTQNAFELVCSTCGKRLFADNAAYEQITGAMELDPDNQFVCDECVDADLNERFER